MKEGVDPLKKASNVPYLIAVVVMVMIGVIAILTIVLMRPTADNTQLIATLVGMIVPTTAAILALMKSQETHLTVNSQLAQWKLDFAALQRSEGAREGIASEQERVAELRKTAAAQRLTEVSIVNPTIANPRSVEATPIEVVLSPHVADTLQKIDANTKAIEVNTHKE